MTRSRLLLCSAVIASVVLIAWYLRSLYFPAWDEEVLLSDGRSVVVHRVQKLNTERRLIETELTIDLPEIGGRQTWREKLYPVLVDVFAGKVYVVGRVTYTSAWWYQDPRYGYVAYVFAGDRWRRVPFASLPELIRSTENIPFCAESNAAAKWREKQRGWCTLEGEFVSGASRQIDLLALEKNFAKMYALSRSTAKSE